MADFFSSGWSIYIATIVTLSLVFCFWMTFTLSRGRRVPGGTVGTTGHTWDETLAEYNNPLPRWWIGLFYLTLVFAVVYLVLYPGFGSNKGVLGWTEQNQYDAEIARFDAQLQPLFDKYLKEDIPAVAADPQAHAMGERLFLTYCMQCHGSDARGSKGFPNLTDHDWQWGGAPATIEKTITDGRMAVMPPMGAAIGGAAAVEDVANYVLSLSGSGHDAAKAALGKEKFAVCAGCHGPEGKGSATVPGANGVSTTGAPNLTDKIWLYGGSLNTIMQTINGGRTNQMPAFGKLLGPGKVRVLAAYVWSLSNPQGGQQAAK